MGPDRLIVDDCRSNVANVVENGPVPSWATAGPPAFATTEDAMLTTVLAAKNKAMVIAARRRAERDGREKWER